MTLPFGFAEWAPWLQALTLGLLTFVQEDVPTVSGALLAASGNLSWPVAFTGCFLGIWIGDALLYLIARGVGRPLLSRPWAQRFVSPDAIARSERWFAERGPWLLVTSRMIPGLRLPTYLAAGFLRLPVGTFLLTTGLAVAGWTLGIFALAIWFGDTLATWLQGFGHATWLLLATAIVIVVMLRTVLKLLNAESRRAFSAAWGRWRHWEFWPAWLFYAPVVANYLRLAIWHRGFTLPTAANPGIFTGGIVGESKMATLQQLTESSPDFTARAILLPAGTDRLTTLEQLRAEHGMAFPFILKPDVGQRGVGVKLIRNAEQAQAYLKQTNAALVLQTYVAGPGEVGVFYVRFPHEHRGRIFAITEKVFPEIVGDGTRTIEQLVWADARARLIAEKYLARLRDRCGEILPRGERLRLVEAGNHAQGCIFRNGAHLCSEAFERRIDEISQRLPGFYIGRYDLRYESAEALRAGKGFQIIELNGAASEATSIYDARNSLLAAYRTLFQQWGMVFAIGAANRRRGIAPTSLGTLWHAWRQATGVIATYPPAD